MFSEIVFDFILSQHPASAPSDGDEINFKAVVMPSDTEAREALLSALRAAVNWSRQGEEREHREALCKTLEGRRAQKESIEEKLRPVRRAAAAARWSH